MDENEVRKVLEQLHTLAPEGDNVARPPAEALAKLQRRLAENGPSPITKLKWRLPSMSSRKPVFVSLALVLLLVVAFTLPPVRAAASDFLGLFRVQKFAAISVSPEQLALLEELADDGLYPGELEMIQEPGPPETVASLAAAEAASGRAVKTIPALGTPTSVQVSGGGQGRLLVDLESARAILDTAGVDPLLLPDSLDGSAVEVTVFPAVEQRWDTVSLVQTESPFVNYPEDVDPTLLGESLLRVLGMAPAEAERLAANIDWTNTLLLPIPEDVASFREVRVAGNSGLALSSVDGNGSSLMWQEEGTVFLLVGEGSVEEILALAQAID